MTDTASGEGWGSRENYGSCRERREKRTGQ